MIRFICKIFSLLSLVVLMIPSYLYFADRINLDCAKNIMLLATIVWFITASVWMWNSESAA